MKEWANVVHTAQHTEAHGRPWHFSHRSAQRLTAIAPSWFQAGIMTILSFKSIWLNRAGTNKISAGSSLIMMILCRRKRTGWKVPKSWANPRWRRLPLKDPSVPICSQTGRGVGDFPASYHAREAETKVGTRGRERACANCLIGFRRSLRTRPLSIWKGIWLTLCYLIMCQLPSQTNNQQMKFRVYICVYCSARFQ